jgi:valyl-tRNA synthetase
MVRDKYGRKMSKSLGNVIDPQEVISGCDLETLIKKIEEGNLPAKEVGCTLRIKSGGERERERDLIQYHSYFLSLLSSPPSLPLSPLCGM